MNILTCPRCGEHKLEIMKSYCFCWECGHSPSEDDQTPQDFGKIRLLTRMDQIEFSTEVALERAS